METTFFLPLGPLLPLQRHSSLNHKGRREAWRGRKHLSSREEPHHCTYATLFQNSWTLKTENTAARVPGCVFRGSGEKQQYLVHTKDNRLGSDCKQECLTSCRVDEGVGISRRLSGALQEHRHCSHCSFPVKGPTPHGMASFCCS